MEKMDCGGAFTASGHRTTSPACSILSDFCRLVCAVAFIINVMIIIIGHFATRTHTEILSSFYFIIKNIPGFLTRICLILSVWDLFIGQIQLYSSMLKKHFGTAATFLLASSSEYAFSGSLNKVQAIVLAIVAGQDK